MRCLWRCLLVVAALMSGSLLLAGCGGGGGEEEVSLDEYFRQVEDISNTAGARGDQLDQEYEGVGQDIEATRDYLDGFLTIGRETVGDLDDLHPPAEARDAHDEFVGALGDFLPLWEDLRDRVADLESPSGLDALAAEMGAAFEAAGQRADAACVELQGIADENAIDVDLGCGG